MFVKIDLGLSFCFLGKTINGKQFIYSIRSYSFIFYILESVFELYNKSHLYLKSHIRSMAQKWSNV